MQCTQSFTDLLLNFQCVFTRPSFRTFSKLMTGWALSPQRRFVTALIVACACIRDGHHSRYHRFFSNAVWCPDSLCLVLGKMLVEELVPTGDILLAVDDTLCRKRGLTVFGTGMHHDPLISSKAKPLTSWGHDWVVLTLIVQNPSWAPTKVFSLPIAHRERFAEAARQRRFDQSCVSHRRVVRATPQTCGRQEEGSRWPSQERKTTARPGGLGRRQIAAVEKIDVRSVRLARHAVGQDDQSFVLHGGQGSLVDDRVDSRRRRQTARSEILLHQPRLEPGTNSLGIRGAMVDRSHFRELQTTPRPGSPRQPHGEGGSPHSPDGVCAVQLDRSLVSQDRPSSCSFSGSSLVSSQVRAIVRGHAHDVTAYELGRKIKCSVHAKQGREKISCPNYRVSQSYRLSVRFACLPPNNITKSTPQPPAQAAAANQKITSKMCET